VIQGASTSAGQRGAALETLRDRARGCTRCPLFQLGTQTVFGRGQVNASLFLVGEQPGNEEDLQGLPFVGPAGRVLSEGLDAAGIDPHQLKT